jgi:alpha 1,6-mannosyltransferase
MLVRPPALFRITIFCCAIFILYCYVFQYYAFTPNQDTAPILPFEISIPKTVHQLFISVPEHPISRFRPNSHTISWQQSGWKLEYWNEDSCLSLSQELASEVPYSQTFQQLPTAILRSDFCRYLIMFGRGGIYNDLDVHLMKPLPWKAMGRSEDEGEGPPALVIGLEGDASTKGLPRSPQFVQWTMAAVPSHPVFQNVLDRIVSVTPSYLEQAAEMGIERDIMNWTGPGIWTDAVLAYLNRTEEQIQNLRDLKYSVRIKDVAVLPKRSFAVIQGEDHSLSDILIKHYFSGTWKTYRKGWINRILLWGY